MKTTGQLSKFPRSRYIDRYLKMRCRQGLQDIRLFPKMKEVTESYGMIEAVAKLKLERKHDNVLFISIGDGVLPRTACLAAHVTKWTCVGVDPAMGKHDRIAKAKALAESTNRLHIIPHKAQNGWKLEDLVSRLDRPVSSFQHLVLAFVHSHCSVKEALSVFSGLKIAKTHILTMPCCYEDDLILPKSGTFEDPHVSSVKNKIHVYRDIYQTARQIVYETGLALDDL